MKITRFVQLSDGIVVPDIQHAHLRPDQRLRTDKDGVNRDRLVFETLVEYRSAEEGAFTTANPLKGFFNYGVVYDHLRRLNSCVLTGTLESLLQSLVNDVYTVAGANHIDVSHCRSSLTRHGLVKGTPALALSRGHPWRAPETGFRAGMNGVPLSLQVDHSQWVSEMWVEHMPMRHDTCLVDFMVGYDAGDIGNLDGLFNYASAHTELMKLQGLTVTLAVETVVATLLHNILTSCIEQKVQWRYVDLLLTRTGYIHATPRIGVYCENDG